MGTTWSEIITSYALVEIDDVRLSEELNQNPALLLRRMALYMNNAVPYFSTPPEMQMKLSGRQPAWDSYEWVSSGSEEETKIDTGIIGYELMSAELIVTEEDGSEERTPYQNAQYDSETGIVAVPGSIPSGNIVSMDFYTDGEFLEELNGEEKRILGKCIALVWYERFATNWLNMQPKIQDKTFSVGNEATHMSAVTDRIREQRDGLMSEMRRYEQNRSYRRTVLHQRGQ